MENVQNPALKGAGGFPKPNSKAMVDFEAREAELAAKEAELAAKEAELAALKSTGKSLLLQPGSILSLKQKGDKELKVEKDIEALHAAKKPITVEAIIKGGSYPNSYRRQVGEKFVISNPIHFSHNWMKLVKAKKVEEEE